jgi:glycosyltransferase involved in cell wall biosynthesis
MHRGIGRYSIALALAMARNRGDHDLRIVLNEGFPDSVSTLRKTFGDLVPPSHITTYSTPAPAAEVDPANAWRVAAGERIREHYLASLRPDVVHVASLFEGLSDNSVTSVLHGDGGFDTAVTLYDLIPLLRQDRYLNDPNVARWYHRKLQSLKNAELLLSISSHAREEAIGVLDLAPDRVVNISSAVDDIFRPRELSHAARTELLARHGLQREYIMYTGGVDPRKNIEGLIEAYALLPAATRRRYQLAVVCSVHDADRVRLMRVATAMKLAPDDLVLTGFVPDDDLVALYNCTSLFIFPSLHEGFGLPALEAMACGAPVIGSNSSSIPEVIGRADALFDPTSVNAIGRAISAVLDDPARAADLRAHGLRQATRFSWDTSAKRAIEAFEEIYRQRLASTTVAVAAPPAARPRLAFISPLPPERSGIAAYSADLLPELAKYYDIDIVLAPGRASEPWDGGAIPQRTVAWFDEHAHLFDRIVYQFGNSDFHTHMFGLLERHPGVVVLHDFFLSGVLSYTEGRNPLPNHYCRMLYLAHGYPALLEEKRSGRTASVMGYPANKSVLERALGVIVHSEHARELARSWYGPAYADDWQVLPLLRTVSAGADRGGARRGLGIDEDDFLVCSFGMLAATKCNDRLIDAWLASPLGQDPRCHLVFVGEGAKDTFEHDLHARIAANPRIRITGYVDDAQYRSYLTSADAAVQLRSGSRGETSAGVLDCLAARLPTIVNAHGSAAEVPQEACLRLNDGFSQAALSDALARLLDDGALRARLADAAGAYMEAHRPGPIGIRYRDAIESLVRNSALAGERRLVAAVAATAAGASPSDLMQAAAAIAANRPHGGTRQLLVDVTMLAETAENQDPAQAYGELVRTLIENAAPGWRVEPVRHDGTRYRYARRWTLNLLGRADLLIEDAVADAAADDLMLAPTPTNAQLFPPAWRARGVAMQALSAQASSADLMRQVATILADPQHMLSL